MHKEKRRKSKNKTRRICGMCKPHKKHPQTDTKQKSFIRREINLEVISFQAPDSF